MILWRAETRDSAILPRVTVRRSIQAVSAASRLTGPASHRLVEHAVGLAVLGEVGELVRAELLREGGLPGLHAVEDVAPGTVLLLGVHDRERAHGVGRPGPQQRCQRSEREGARARLGEDTDAGERPQHAPERGGVSPGHRGQILDRPRPVGGQVGNAQPGGDVECRETP
jgi:hypothetical protein